MGRERSATVRQEMIDAMTEGPHTLRDLSQTVGIMEKEVAEHLPFIEKSLKRKGKTIRFQPYQCMNCGFVFENRKKYSKPGKCPSCKKERIEQACFWIE